MEIMKPWITQRTTELMGFEDELVINFVFSQLEQEVYAYPLLGSATVACTYTPPDPLFSALTDLLDASSDCGDKP